MAPAQTTTVQDSADNRLHSDIFTENNIIDYI